MKNNFPAPVLYSLGILILIGMVYTVYPAFSKENKENNAAANDKILIPLPAEDRLPQQIRSIYLHDNFNFAGEEIPLEDDDVRERLERELTVNSYFHSSTILNIKKSQRFFPLMEEILKEYDIPEDFKYVAVVESNLDNVTSPAGARGFWQLMPAVAKSYGLTINNEIDERYNLEKATVAAAKLILDYKKKFETWTNAAGAYNIGEGNFRREMGIQKESNYFNMNFGSETNRYVFRILALKEILAQPEMFGFDISPQDRYRPYEEKTTKVTVTESIKSLADFAHQHGMSYRDLKVYNPWLLTSHLTVGQGQSYELAVLK